MILTKAYLGSTEIKKAYLGSTLVFDNTVVVSGIYDDVSVIYTLRRPSMATLWTNAVLKIRRDSDNATAYVFFDGSLANHTISLSSLISTTSATTPDATTLATWIGANNGFVEEWIGITSNNTIDANKTAAQLTITAQPQFVSGGVIATKNSTPAIDFLSDTRYLESPVNTDLDSGNSFSLLTVTNNNVLNSNAGIIDTNLGTTPSNDRFDLRNDNRTNKFINLLRASGVNFLTLLLSQQNTTNQKLLTSILDSSNIKSYFNSALQDSVVWSGSYNNLTLSIGVLNGLTSTLNGTIQEIIIFPTDKTADLTALDADINNYYAIY